MRSPDTAAPRPDIGWLRHRRVAPHHIEYTHPPRHPSAAAPAQVGPPAPTPDLAPPTPDLAPPSLDLTPARPAAPAARPAGPGARVSAPLPYPRVQPGTTVVLAGRPTVTLTRLQSGVGQLRVALVAGGDAGDLAPGLVCETADGATYVLQGDVRATPATPTPLVRVSGGGYLVDLRQVGRLRRALLYGYSPSRAVLTWAGAVVTTTHDGSRIEAPFALPPLSGTVALATLYNVHGELVLRSELEPFAGPPEMAGEAYGYHGSWLPGR